MGQLLVSFGRCIDVLSFKGSHREVSVLLRGAVPTGSVGPKVGREEALQSWWKKSASLALCFVLR